MYYVKFIKKKKTLNGYRERLKLEADLKEPLMKHGTRRHQHCGRSKAEQENGYRVYMWDAGLSCPFCCITHIYPDPSFPSCANFNKFLKPSEH